MNELFLIFNWLKAHTNRAKLAKNICKLYNVKFQYSWMDMSLNNLSLPTPTITTQANPVARIIKVSPLHTDGDFFTALYHELGHLQHEHGNLVLRRHVVTPEILVEECAAWYWAFENMPESLREEAKGNMRRTLSTYFIGYKMHSDARVLMNIPMSHKLLCKYMQELCEIDPSFMDEMKAYLE